MISKLEQSLLEKIIIPFLLSSESEKPVDDQKQDMPEVVPSKK